MKRRKTWRVAGGILLLTALLFCAVLSGRVLGEETNSPLTGSTLCESGDTLLLCAETPDGTYLALTGAESGTLLRVKEEDDIFVRVDLGYPLLGVACHGGKLFVFREWFPFVCAYPFTEDLQEGEPVISTLTADNVAFFDCNAEGDVYAVGKDDLRTLFFFEPEGMEPWERTFFKPIRLLQVTENGNLWVCTEDACFVLDSMHPDISGTISGAVPQSILYDDMFLDADGNVWQVTGNTAEIILTDIPGTGLCHGDAEGVIYTDETGCIHRLLRDGTAAGVCSTEGQPLALTEKGVLYRKEGALCYATYSFQDNTEPPAPSEPPESSEPEPAKPDWLDQRDGYLYITGEVPMEWLVKELEPQEVLMKTPAGETVTDGFLATGMTVFWGRDSTMENEAIVVVRGDCDGNGRIAPPDMEQAQLILLRGDSAESPYFLAADHDENGEVTTEDLLWLSHEMQRVAGE